MTRSLCPVLAYVPHSMIIEYMRVGWMVVVGDLGATHREFSVLMGWPCDCELRLPKKQETPMSLTRT